MKLLKALLPFVSTVLSGTPVGRLLAGVNAVLPNENKLPADATGQQVIDAYTTVPPELQNRMDAATREVEMEKQHREQWKAMNEADASGNSTRPTIALQMSKLVVFQICAFTVFCSMYSHRKVLLDLRACLSFGLFSAP
jgi:hypothetical protein